MIPERWMCANLDEETTTALAKDITNCTDCPLYNQDCIGGWTSGSGGTLIEPPCSSWNENDEIYKGMYD